MPRDMSGTYTIPAGTLNPAVGGTVISADDWNDFILDLEQAVTDSMVTGATVFTGAAEFDPGSSANPGIFFTGDPNSGVFHPGADQIGITVNGGNSGVIATFAETVATIDGALHVTGSTDIDTNLNVDGTLTVDGVSTLTGRVTLGAGIAGILTTDLPTENVPAIVSDDVDATATVSGDANWHDLLTPTEVTTVAAARLVMIILGPSVEGTTGSYFSDGLFAELSSTGADISGRLRVSRCPGPAYAVWTEVGAINVGYYTGVASIWNPAFSFVDVPGAGDYKYKLEGRVSDPGGTMTVNNYRFQVITL